MRGLSWILLVCLGAAICPANAASPPPVMPSDSAAPDSTLMTAAVNGFGLDLYRSLAAAHPGEAIFFSPYSILAALGAAAEGARGETAAEMFAVLHLPAEEATRHAGLTAFKQAFSGLTDVAAARRDDATLDSLRSVASHLRRRAKVVKDSMLLRDAGVRDPEVSRRLRAESDRLPGMQGDVAARIGEALRRRGPMELSEANALWVEQTLPLAEAYLRTVDACYETGSARPADFRAHPDAERIRINQWVEQATHARIQDLLPEGVITDLTRIVLVNAIYFRSAWRSQFNRADTKEADFLLADGTTVRASMMGQHTREIRYAAFEADGSPFDTPMEVRRGEDPARCYPGPGGFAMVEIPYREPRLSMVVIAPNRPNGLGALEEMCDADTLARWIRAGRKREVELHLPYFGCRTGYDLRETLAAMGMASAFRPPGTPDGADFSGMTDSLGQDSELSISFVLHRAFIQVNEEGTEASAATAVEAASLGLTVIGEMMPFVPVFRADRPFLYFIRDTRTGVMLFLGRVMNPA